ncbi:hypothetical protein ACFQAT_15410 [Undibacterium arcticum]|uniref:Uncharacterized protein n=1 Tax=Undibacterium arcticum TaxID=1762892 RepID=A0ABV7EUR8_9BURK
MSAIGFGQTGISFDYGPAADKGAKSAYSKITVQRARLSEDHMKLIDR